MSQATKNQSPVRRYARVKAAQTLKVAWQCATHHQTSLVANIGLGGLFLNTSDAPKVGTTLQLLFLTRDGEVRARAVVRTVVAGKGMGIEITAMQPEHRARLNSLLKPLSAESKT